MSSSLNAGLSGMGISTQMSQLSSILLGTKSVYQPKGSSALTPTFRNESNYLAPVNGVINPPYTTGYKVVYALPKSSTLIGKMWSEITLAPAQTNPNYYPPIPANPLTDPQTAATLAVGTPQAEYVKNVGDLVFEQIILRYGSTVLQQYDSEAQVFYRQMTRNNVNIEYINVEVLGGLPPGGNTEQTLIDALYNGIRLRQPVEHLWFVQQRDQNWMPESLALEGQLEFTLRALGQLIVTRTGDDTVFSGTPLEGDPAVLPAITDLRLRYQEITLSASEKENRLRFYKAPEGLVNLMYDIETQKGFRQRGTAGGGLMVMNVPLTNFRLDMKEVIFTVRIAEDTGSVSLAGYVYNADLRDWRGSRCEANVTTPSLLGGGGGHLGVAWPGVVEWKMTAGGKDMINPLPELYTRCHVRKEYHPDAQTSGAVYHLPFALFPEDSRNGTGHASASVLGNLALVIVVTNPGAHIVLQVDVWSFGYNVNQSRAGGIAKALH